jgi:hypothetical protein
MTAHRVPVASALVVLLLLLLAPLSAAALTRPQSGPYLDLAGGGVFGGAPFAAGVAWRVDAGVWFGPYDNEFALGRFWSVGVGLRQDLRDGGLHSAVVAEVRRGMDIIVLGGHVWLAGGPQWIAPQQLGAVADAGVGIKARIRTFGPLLGILLRLGGGVETGRGGAPDASAVAGRGTATLGFEFAKPWRFETPR